MNQSQIVLGLFLPADQKLAKAIVPGASALDDPAARWMRWRSVRCHFLFSAPADVGTVRPLAGPGLNLRIVVAFVQTQMLRMVAPWCRPRHDEPVHGGQSCFHVMAIRGGNHHCQWRTALVGQDVALRTRFPTVRRVRTRRRPPKGALIVILSSDWKCHLIPCNSSYRSSSFSHSFANTPVRCHFWKRLWQVLPDPNSLGTAFHCQPVRSTYRMPSSTLRKGTAGRPGVPSGFSGDSRGFISVQTSSGRRQIVGRCFDFAIAISAPIVAVMGAVIASYYSMYPSFRIGSKTIAKPV